MQSTSLYAHVIQVNSCSWQLEPTSRCQHKFQAFQSCRFPLPWHFAGRLVLEHAVRARACVCVHVCETPCLQRGFAVSPFSFRFKQGAASISGLRCLTKTVQICCDIEKGRLLYVPANVQTEMCTTHLNKVAASEKSVSFQLL